MKHIPLHEFLEDDDTSVHFRLIKLEEKTEYDTAVSHRHNYYEIFLFEKGGGLHQIDFHDIEIQSPCIHFVSPGQIHLVNRDLNSAGYVILFSREFYYLNLENRASLFNMPFLNNNHWKPIINLSDEDFSHFQSLIVMAEEEYKSNNSERDSILRSYINIVLQKSKTLFLQQEKALNFNESASAELVSSFKILLEKNYREMHQVQDYAKALNCTPEHLNQTLKIHYGNSASDLILRRIILEAKRLLMYSELSNKEIAYWLNYEDPSYFSRIFKRKTQLTPNMFREMHMKKANPEIR